MIKKFKNLKILQNKQFFGSQKKTKLQFDQDGFCQLYKDKNGEHDLRNAVRITFSFSSLNAFLMVTEYANPIFGGWNLFAFTSSFLLGAGIMTCLNVFSKRIIHEVKINRDGNQLEILYFNAFWIPQKQNVQKIIKVFCI